MSDLLSFLPGDIPGLLLRGSPIRCVGPDSHRRRWVGLVEQVHSDGRARIAWNAGVHGVERIADVTLDLTDPTGRVHSAWWANEREKTFLWPTDPQGEDEAVMLAMLNQPMSPAQIDTLARLVLRLAGRTP